MNEWEDKAENTAWETFAVIMPLILQTTHAVWKYTEMPPLLNVKE